MTWWNVLRNRRRKRDGVHQATRGIALMHNLAMTGCPGLRRHVTAARPVVPRLHHYGTAST
ncbi:hypothetical protein [Actinomadura graeca]|uniref:hypothetical protein n=1 Tax=Actinomadura graeca TaxID=2750812 RepID=UPI003B8354AE